MTIYQLECFIAVAEELNFSAAAQRLFTTQPAVTYQINTLEKETGLHLFDRTTRSVQLTDEGRRFYQEIAPLLAGLEEAANAAADSALTVRGRLRVNIDPYFSRLVLGPVLGDFVWAIGAATAIGFGAGWLNL